MKKQLNKWLSAIAIAAFMFTGCSKEEQANVSDNSSAFTVPEIDVLTSETDAEFTSFEVGGGTETEGFYAENDGIPDAYQVSESTADELNSAKRDGNARRMRACLSELKLDADQIAKLKRVFHAFDDCKSGIVKRHSLAMRELTARINARHEALVKAYKSGRIDKETFEKGIKALRSEFNQTQKLLARKASAALKDCYHKMLRAMHGILSERQWKAFVACYRH